MQSLQGKCSHSVSFPREIRAILSAWALWMISSRRVCASQAHLPEVGGDVRVGARARDPRVHAGEVEAPLDVEVELRARERLAHVEGLLAIEALRHLHGELDRRAEALDPIVDVAEGARREV